MATCFSTDFPGGATHLKKELHIISDIIFDEQDFIETSKEIHSYVTAIHLRVKAWSAHKLFTLIERLEKKGISPSKIYVNDRVDVAIAAQAGGVQLSFRSLPVNSVKSSFSGIRIGKSVHTLDEAKQAESDGADYIMFGSVFSGDRSLDAPEQGLEKLQTLKQEINIPVIATDGITQKNVESVLPFADGVAVHTSMWQAADRPATIKHFHNLLSGWES